MVIEIRLSYLICQEAFSSLYIEEATIAGERGRKRASEIESVRKREAGRRAKAVSLSAVHKLS